jgi:cytochrome P450
MVGKRGATYANFPTVVKCLSYLPFGFSKGIEQGVTRTFNYASQSLERYRKLIENDPNNAPPTLIAKLFKDEDEGVMSFSEIQSEARTYIIAGSDTTAITLTYIVWEVINHPAAKARLLQELAGVPDNFGAQDVRNLPFVDRIIEETLRVRGPLQALLPRLAPEGGTKLAGHWVPGGTVVSSQAYCLHRNPEIFPDPTEWKPERWENPTKAMKDSILSFGGGSRSEYSPMLDISRSEF